MVSIIKAVFYLGPLLFGLGFIAPLVAQSISAMGIAPPFGLSPLMVGLITGAGYGALAQVRGRWI
ncbi:MAG: hypothetical protein AAFX86_07445 [Pseudomonadota bacterium]